MLVLKVEEFLRTLNTKNEAMINVDIERIGGAESMLPFETVMRDEVLETIGEGNVKFLIIFPL